MAVDIFQAINALFAGRDMPEYPHPFILHRFLGSDPDYCMAASEIQHTVQDPDLVYGVWQHAVPRGNPPRVKYVGPRKGPAAEELVARIMRVENISRREAEEAVEILTMANKYEEACVEYGIEQKKSK